MVYEYFKIFDIDNSGILDRGQFELMMKYFGYYYFNMDKIFVKMNRYNNGKFFFWEFMIWLNWVLIEQCSMVFFLRLKDVF